MQMSLARKVAVGSITTAVLGGVGGFAMYRDRLKQNKSVTAEAFNETQNKDQMSALLAWVRTTSANPTLETKGLGLEMFRYTTCPFCGKVKAFLDYHRIPHETVEVEPMFKSQLAGSEYKKLPVMRFGGDKGVYFVDSDIIVDTLAEQVGADSQLSDPDVQRWRSWARESLVRHVTLNINKTLIEAWQGYAYIDRFDTIPLINKLFLKVVGAPVMYMVARHKTLPTLVKAGEVTEGDDLRAVFYQQIDNYVNEAKLSDKKPFHGGPKPDLADLDIYGVLQCVRGHALYDDVLRNTSIGAWMGRMDEVTGKEQYVA